MGKLLAFWNRISDLNEVFPLLLSKEWEASCCFNDVGLEEKMRLEATLIRVLYRTKDLCISSVSVLMDSGG